MRVDYFGWSIGIDTAHEGSDLHFEVSLSLRECESTARISMPLDEAELFAQTFCTALENAKKLDAIK